MPPEQLSEQMMAHSAPRHEPEVFPKPPNGLRQLAIRLTPNPARTVEGTMAIIADGIARIDDEEIARLLGFASAREQGLDVAPLSDADWELADPDVKLQLIYSAKALKAVLKLLAEDA